MGDEQRPYPLQNTPLHRSLFIYMSGPARRRKPTRLGLDSLNKSRVLSSGSLATSLFPSLPFQSVSLGLCPSHGLRCRPARNSQGMHGFLFHHRSETTTRQNGEWLAGFLGADLLRNPMRNLDLAL